MPLLAVLRPGPLGDIQALASLRCRIATLQQVGLEHVEIAVSTDPAWVMAVRDLVQGFPALSIGAASVRSPVHLERALEAGLGFAVSPILDPELLRLAAEQAITLVPGVFSPSDVHQAQQWGCPLVKLYPAASLGPNYWLSLRSPLAPLPGCIAAGGLRGCDVSDWLAAGVDAVALGTGLFVDGPGEPQLDGAFAGVIAHLRLGDGGRDANGLLSS